MSTPPDDPLERALAPLRELLALSQTGLFFSKDPFDRERYTRVRALVETLLRSPGDLNFDSAVLLGQDKGYITPKVDVRGAAFLDGRVLMVRERSDGLWTLPGGWCDVNDSPSESVVKEIQQESGYEARAVKLAALLDRRKHPHPPSSITSTSSISCARSRGASLRAVSRRTAWASSPRTSCRRSRPTASRRGRSS